MVGYTSPSGSDTSSVSPDALIYCKTNIGGYFFDGFMKVNYSKNLKITSNPVETGAALVDHAYLEPAQITMDIMMSDVHRSAVLSRDQFDGSWSRSVDAWNILSKIQSDRIPVSVNTRLGFYDNMLIQSLEANDNTETFRSLKATVTLVEIPIARVRKVKISAADQTTINTERGKIEAQKVRQELESILYQWYGGGS